MVDLLGIQLGEPAAIRDGKTLPPAPALVVTFVELICVLPEARAAHVKGFLPVLRSIQRATI